MNMNSFFKSGGDLKKKKLTFMDAICCQKHNIIDQIDLINQKISYLFKYI